VFERTLDIEAAWLSHSEREGLAVWGGRGSEAATAKCWEFVQANYPGIFEFSEQWVNTKAAVHFLNAKGRKWLAPFV
jgi:hypothetical protein